MDAHIILKPDLYSIQNLVDVKNGELGKILHNLIVSCNKHINNCQVKQIFYTLKFLMFLTNYCNF